jgi:hypothetical protein
LTFDLGEKLAPKMHRHGRQASAEHADHVILERVGGFLGKVAMMVIRGGKFIYHLGEYYFSLVCKQCLVVEYLVSWDNATSGHLRECTMAGKNEFALAVILEGLAPGGVGVHVVEDHDVVVAKDGDEGEMAIWSVYIVSFKLMTRMRMSCAIMCVVGVGLLTGTVMLGRLASLVVPGASMGQVDWTP